MPLAVATLVLGGAFGSAVLAGRAREFSSEARRLLLWFFSACAAVNFVVGLYTWESHDGLASVISLLAGIVVVFGVFRFARSNRPLP